MSYWTKRRKVKKNVRKHITEIESQLSSEQEPHLSTCNDEEQCTSYQLGNSNDEEIQNLDDSNEEPDIDSVGYADKNEILEPRTRVSEDAVSSDIFEEDLDTSYYLISSDSDSDLDDNHDVGINEQLAQWAVDCNIPNDSIGKLLMILKSHIKGLPTDPRTLLGTKLSYEIKSLCGGQYYHFGLATGIQNVILWQTDSLDILDCIKVQLSIDGLPLFKSSSGQFWPILGRVENIGNNEPFIIGLFYGKSKPSDVSLYLNSLIEELNELTTTGLMCMDLHYNIAITSVICDSPARAFIKNVKQYSGYYGCDKCIQSGMWLGKMTYPEFDSSLRTDEDFKNRVQEDHHKGPSPLENIVGMVSQFPLDYMHLVCLGVVKKLILSWLKGKLNIRIGGAINQQISNMLFSYRHFVPSEFARKPRGFSEIDRWKATEYRQFLLYTGPVVLSQFMNEVVYRNFMLLSVSLRILLNSYLVQHYSDYANKLLLTFVQHYAELYGKENIVFNVHGLIHLTLDAEKFGTLDNISSFPFENYLMKIKKMVRKPTFPLQQVIRRLSEKKPKVIDTTNMEILKRKHTCGPLVEDFNVSNCTQYKSVKLGNFVFSLRQCDRFFRVDNLICQLENILEREKDIYVVYRTFALCRKFFDSPLDSDLLGIYLVSDLSERLHVKAFSDIQSKYVVLPFRNDYVAMPFTDTNWTDSALSYLVVEFKDEQQVDIIPRIWLKGKDKCLWPNYKHASRIEKAVRTKEIPDGSYGYHDIARIMYQTDSYSRALLKVKQAEVQSDLQTEEEDIGEGKRIRRPTVRYESESDSTPVKRRRIAVSVASDSSPERTPQKRKANTCRPRVLPDLPRMPTPPRQIICTPLQEVVRREPGPSTPNEINTVSPRQTGVTIAERKMIELLEEIKQNTLENKRSIAIILRKLDARNDGVSSVPSLPNGIVLPLTNIDNFKRVETLLENEDVAKKLITHLGTIGGDSVGECCRRTLKYLMTNDLATNFNWKGQGDRKHAFGVTKLLAVVKGAVRKNRLTALATDNDIDKVVKDWFRYAKDRDGGRKQRAAEQKRRQEASERQNSDN